ncbi:MAG TPA: hypothetical protein VME47_09580 [Acetobacteraceae bacterium]|nr:hypothetical protein [Acetobacteraceae bacterium]
MAEAFEGGGKVQGMTPAGLALPWQGNTSPDEIMAEWRLLSTMVAIGVTDLRNRLARGDWPARLVTAAEDWL